MPKQKTHRASAKRFRVTGRGKIVRKRSGRSHLNAHMGSRAKRALDKSVVVTDAHAQHIAVCLPYKKYL